MASSSKFFSNPSLLLGFSVIFILAPLSLSRETPSLPITPILKSHGGPLVNGTLNLSLLWYGQFTPSQKDRIRNFIDSLNYDAKEGLDPKVSSWWRVVESYQSVGGSNHAPLKIGVKVVASYVDESMKYGEELKGENISKLVETAAGEKFGLVPVIFASRQVNVEGFCSRMCQQHSLSGRQPYILVSNPELHCPGECAWPFHVSKHGPSGMTFQPPSGDVGADAMIINLATALADYATNPNDTGFYFQPHAGADKKSSADHDDVVEAATACTRVFGSGAFPGFAGKIRVDPETGGAFNAHGVNHLKFLVPAVWNPKTISCWTPM